jgi:hypothetical protein
MTFNDSVFTALRSRFSIHRFLPKAQKEIIAKQKAPRNASKVVVRNPVWAGQGRPSPMERKALMDEITKINKSVFDALA